MLFDDHFNLKRKEGKERWSLITMWMMFKRKNAKDENNIMQHRGNSLWCSERWRHRVVWKQNWRRSKGKEGESNYFSVKICCKRKKSFFHFYSLKCFTNSQMMESARRRQWCTYELHSKLNWKGQQEICSRGKTRNFSFFVCPLFLHSINSIRKK